MGKGFFTLLLFIMTALPALAASTNTSDNGGIDAAGFKNLSTALSSPITAGNTVIVSTPMTINNKTTDRAINVIKGGMITVNTGKNLTINGPFSPGMYRVFAGTGTVVLGPGMVKSVHPEWWGAVSGADNTVSIQAAVKACPAGSIVVLPKSMLSTKITVSNSNITITSQDAEISFASNYNSPCEEYGPAQDLVMFMVPAGVPGVKFEKITFNCLWTGAAHTGILATIHFAINSTWGVVKDCTFNDQVYVNSVSVLFRIGTKYHKATDCLFKTTNHTYGGGGAVVASGDGEEITNCKSVDLKDSSFSLDVAKNSKMVGNTVFNTYINPATGKLWPVGSMMQASAGAYNFIISNNTLYGVSGVGILTYESITTGVHNGIIEGNTIDGGGDVLPVTDNYNGALIAVYETSSNITISNNILRNIAPGSPAFIPIIVPFTGIKVLGNTIDVTASSASRAIDAYATTGSGTSFLEVRNNTIIGVAASGVYVRAAGVNLSRTKLLLSGNTYRFSNLAGSVAINMSPSPSTNLGLEFTNEIFGGLRYPITGTRIDGYFDDNSSEFPHIVGKVVRIYGSAKLPTTGSWVAGDEILIGVPHRLAYSGWRCKTSGDYGATPPVWLTN